MQSHDWFLQARSQTTQSMTSLSVPPMDTSLISFWKQRSEMVCFSCDVRLHYHRRSFRVAVYNIWWVSTQWYRYIKRSFWGSVRLNCIKVHFVKCMYEHLWMNYMYTWVPQVHASSIHVHTYFHSSNTCICADPCQCVTHAYSKWDSWVLYHS